jgi:type II secretory ATPase GspE/PulE/Tfp pilus assembly ATPase PilB-like protein
VRTICKDCKKQKTLTEERFNEINKLRPDVGEFLKPNEMIYEGSGCSSCNDSGYRGRVGLFEVLELNKDIRDLVAEESSSDRIFEAARKNGLMLVVEDGVKKVREGLTTIDELLRVTAVRE